MTNKKLIMQEIKNQFPWFPIELLDLIANYVKCDIMDDCKSMGIVGTTNRD